MEKKQCTDCRVSKDLDKFTNENRACNSCLERSERKRGKTQWKKESGNKNISRKIENVWKKKRKNTEQRLTKLKKNAKYVNALTKTLKLKT